MPEPVARTSVLQLRAEPFQQRPRRWLAQRTRPRDARLQRRQRGRPARLPQQLARVLPKFSEIKLLRDAVLVIEVPPRAPVPLRRARRLEAARAVAGPAVARFVHKTLDCEDGMPEAGLPVCAKPPQA